MGDDLLTDQKIAEEISKAYARVVAHMAGYETGEYHNDWGTDMMISEVHKVNDQFIQTGVNLIVQLKSTKNAREIGGDRISYDLENKTRNKLVYNQGVGSPQILVVLCLPEQKEHWAVHDVEKLVLKKCAYWYYMQGQPTVTNDNSTTVVHIPKSQTFSMENLKKIMDVVKNRGDLNSI